MTQLVSLIQRSSLRKCLKKIQVIDSSFFAFSIPQAVSFFEKKKGHIWSKSDLYREIDIIMDGILVNFL